MDDKTRMRDVSAARLETAVAELGERPEGTTETVWELLTDLRSRVAALEGGEE